jgi:hypothetical protein
MCDLETFQKPRRSSDNEWICPLETPGRGTRGQIRGIDT